MRVYVNDIPSMNTPDSLEYTPDDRQQIVQTDGGNVIQDYGHVPSGDKLTVTGLQYRLEDFKKVYKIWQERTLVDFIDSNGNCWKSVRIKITKYSYNPRFKDIINTNIEIYMI